MMLALSKKLYQFQRLDVVVADLRPEYYHDTASPLDWAKVGVQDQQTQHRDWGLNEGVKS